MLFRSASGVIARDAAPEALIKSVYAVMNGVLWVDRKILQSILCGVHEHSGVERSNGLQDLTPREKDIVRAVVMGQVNKEIAESLKISEYTVKHHLTRIFDKLRVANRVELAVFALTHGLADHTHPVPTIARPA